MRPDKLTVYDGYSRDILRDILANERRRKREGSYGNQSEVDFSARKISYIERLLNRPGTGNANKDPSSPSDRLEGWPKIWSPTDVRPKVSGLIGSVKPYNVLGVTLIPKQYQKFGHLGKELHDFPVFVEQGKSFMSKFPKISERWLPGKRGSDPSGKINVQDYFDYESDPYYAMLAGMYIASFLSGMSLISVKDPGAPDIVKSIARFHLYYQTRKFMRHTSLISKYDVSGAKNMIPWRHGYVRVSGEGVNVLSRKYGEVKLPDVPGLIPPYPILSIVNLTDHDYYGMIANTSEGITGDVGLSLFQESVEVYVYCVLGAQAKTRWSIHGQRAKSVQTQQVFRKLVEDSIALGDNTTSTISNMRRAIQDTNVHLNLAICPGVILVPSRMIILEKPTPGYNNILSLASGDMKFGVNEKVNYYPDRIPKTTDPKPNTKPKVKPKTKPSEGSKEDTTTPTTVAPNPDDTSYSLPLIFAGVGSIVFGSLYYLRK